MLKPLLLFLLLTLTACTTSIPAADLTARPVIGGLGLPLGTVAEVQATLIAGDARSKGESDRLFLHVTHVNGKPLPSPCKIEFDPADSFEKNAVGTALRLSTYETGRYSGIPANMPRDAAIWQDRAFHFSTTLVILAVRK